MADIPLSSASLAAVRRGQAPYVLPEATSAALGGVLMGAAVADATDAATALTQLNALLASLRTAGVIAPEPPEGD